MLVLPPETAPLGLRISGSDPALGEVATGPRLSRRRIHRPGPSSRRERREPLPHRGIAGARRAGHLQYGNPNQTHHPSSRRPTDQPIGCGATTLSLFDSRDPTNVSTRTPQGPSTEIKRRPMHELERRRFQDQSGKTFDRTSAGFGERVFETVEMLSVNDVDCHVTGKPNQLSTAGIGDDRNT